MKNLIGIAFIIAVVSMVFVPLSDAATWKECTDTTPPTTVDGYRCCCIGGSCQWRTDCTPPTCDISSIGESYYKPDTHTVYYNTGSEGSFTVYVSSTDGESGVQKVNFPITVSEGGDDTTSPYSMDYIWGMTSTFEGSAIVTCYNNAQLQLTKTTTFTVDKDVTPPSGGSISYPNGYYKSSTVTITVSAGSDAESGVNTASDYIERQEATLTSSSCGTFGSWAPIKVNPDTSYVDTVSSGKCYQYRYIVSDNVGNLAPLAPPYTSTNILKVDTVPPVAGVYTISPVYTSGSLAHSWSGFSDALSGLYSFEIWRALYNANSCPTGTEGTCNWGALPYYTTQSPTGGGSGNPAAGTWTTDSVNMDYWYGWHSSDNAGNFITESDKNGDGVRDGYPIRVFFDNTLPTVSVSIFPSSPKSTDQVTFTATASDNIGVAKIIIYVDENNDGNFNDATQTCYSSTCSLTRGPYASGQTVSYYALAYDAAGNQGSTLPTKSFIVRSSDITPPTITLISVGGDTTSPYTTNDNTPDVVFSTDENAWCRISTTDQSYDSMTTNCATGEGTLAHTCTSPLLADGARNLYMACKDSVVPVPNFHTSINNKDIPLTVDIPPPTFTIQYYSDIGLTTSLGNNPKLKTGTYYIKITASEALSAAPTISINAEGTANDVSNAATTLVSGNDYKYTRTIVTEAAAVGTTLEDLSITGTDVAGNLASNANPTNEATKAAYTDTTAPTTTAVVTGDSSPYTITLTCTDASGCKEIKYCVDNANSCTPTNLYSTPFSQACAATCYVRYYSTDNANNQETTKSTPFGPGDDVIPPTGSITINSGVAYTTSTSTTLTLSCSDVSGCSQMKVSNDGATWSTSAYSTTKPWTLTSGDGPKTVHALFSDTKNNWMTTSVNDIIILDTTPPRGGPYTLNSLPSGPVYTSGSLAHSWSGFNDSGSGLYSFEIWRALYNANSCPTGTEGTCNWGATAYHLDTTNPATGSWTETVSNNYMYGWHSSDNAGNFITESDKNGDGVRDGYPIRVFFDNTPPSCSISSITKSSSYAYVSGSTIYYSTASTGSFTVTVSSSDTSGVQKVNFPNTVSNGGDDTSSPYEKTYSWDASDTFDSSSSVTCYDSVGNTNTATFTVNRDTDSPSGVNITYADGYYTTASVTLTLSVGTDTESGVNTATDYIERQEATLSSGSCGSFGSWATVVTNPSFSSWIDTTVVNGKCYKYRYSVSDNVNKWGIYASANTAKIETSYPAVGQAEIYSGTTYQSGSNYWYKGTISIRASASDGESGIPSCEYTTGGSAWSSATYDGTYCNKGSLSPAATITINFRATNGAGQTTTGISRSYTYDAAAPTTSISATSPPDGASYTFGTWAKNDVKITLSCTDNSGGSGCSTTKYCTDTSNTCTPSTAYSAPFTISTEGTTYVRYGNTDNLGTPETIQSKIVKIDKTNPTAGNYRINGQTTGPVYTSGSLAHSWSGFNDTNCPTCSGLYSFEIWRADYNPTNCREGDVSGCSWIQRRTDTTNPATGSWTETVSNNYMYGWHSSDNAGNWIKETTPFRVVYDTTAPTVIINSPAADSVQANPDFTVSVTFTDNVGLARCEYQVWNNGPTGREQTFPASGWQTIDCSGTSSSASIKLTNSLTGNCRYDGIRTCEILVRANDGLNTADPLASRKFSRDIEGPVVSTTSPTTACKNENTEFKASVSDKGSGIASNGCIFIVDGVVATGMTVSKVGGETCGPGDNCEAVATYSFTTAVDHDVYARCSDNLPSSHTTSGSIQRLSVGPEADFSFGTTDSPLHIWKSDSSPTTGSATITATYLCNFKDTIGLSVIPIGGSSTGVTSKLTDMSTPPNVITILTPPTGTTTRNENFRLFFDIGSNAALQTKTYQVTGTSTGRSETIDITLDVMQPCVRVSASKPSVKADNTDTSEITASTCNSVSGVPITLTTNLAGSTFENGAGPVTCTTGLGGVCPMQRIKSTAVGTATITADAPDYTASTATVNFVNIPACILAASPARSPTPFSSSISVTYNYLTSAPETIDINCGNGNTATATGCTGVDGTCSATCNYDRVTSQTTYSVDTVQNFIGGANCAPASITADPPLCSPLLGIVDMPYYGADDGLGSKQGLYAGARYKWNLQVRDSSTQCDGTSFIIPFVTKSPGCNDRTGIYLTDDDWKRNKKLTIPNSFPAMTGLHDYKIFAESADETTTCTLTFDFIDPLGRVVDPSFTVNPGATTPQAPQVSFFHFTGDENNFDVNWEAFYPNLPTRTMEVKCGLNCDPDSEDCSAVTGSGCLPYPYVHGSEELKSGRCMVSNPIYSFDQESLKCIFYNPNDLTLKTSVTNAFAAVDFKLMSTKEIITTVGKSVELKVDIGNNGILTDDYSVTILANKPEAIYISPTSTTVENVKSNQAASAIFSVTPVVDTNNELTITVTSNTNPSRFETWKVTITSGLFALPEFGLTGFIQIIAIATVVYFLTRNIKFNPRKRRSRR